MKVGFASWLPRGLLSVLLVAGCTTAVESKTAMDLQPPPYDPADGKTWTLSRAEEFSGDTLNLANLSPCNPWSSAITEAGCGDSFNKGREHFSPSAVIVENGVATLVATPMSPAVASDGCYSVTQNPPSSCDYRAGQLQGSPAPGLTAQYPKAASDYLWSFTYGFMEVRWKLPPDAQGFAPAFWMADTDGQRSNDAAKRTFDYHWEIDMEIPGTPGWPGSGDQHSSDWLASPVFMSYVYHDKVANPNGGRDLTYRVNYDNGPVGFGFPPIDARMNGDCPGSQHDYSGDWHTFAIDWQATHVRWWIDRELCGEYVDPTGATIPGPPTKMFPIVWIGVDQRWNRSLSANLDSSCVLDPSLVPCNLTGSSGASKTLLVDYMRLWQQT